MDLDLAGRRALVTGSSGGIGAAIANALAAEGCAVLIHGRNADAAQATAKRLRSAGAETGVVLGDLTADGVVDDVASAALAFGTDILVNNAGPFAEHDWNNARARDWLATYHGNVVTVAQITQALLPNMQERRWGRVINIGSRAVITPLANMVEYSAAKAAVVNMTTSLAQHLAGTGVTANCVSPGVIRTPSFERMFRQRMGAETVDWTRLEAEAVARYAPNPAGRLGRADDIADAVTFLASPRAGYINGVNLRVDGGITGTP
ncbi:SDR family NAD(P)-dependent oxidoreductase [Phytoactinopolyspora mesophila]|uniref:SDR family NAD(P)-dependent oxidoreductase n=1 Tax=Phytoactinopolyspora mesophila TaxID=2650750 RepID=A0A7K3M2N3_9ACTN|nr:SDR family NAD(P)-dependent oxidoreductase [Phytoactinopolyspora mesophila]NDL57546.1 SDR family NAD(P)-dependent oxidoreductase [Phytoactinopolyspora mesophila]